MLHKIPKSITTTEIQRNPKILQKLNKNKEIRLIIRESEQLGVYIPIDVYNEIIEFLQNSNQPLSETKQSQEIQPKSLIARKSYEIFFDLKNENSRRY